MANVVRKEKFDLYATQTMQETIGEERAAEEGGRKG